MVCAGLRDEVGGRHRGETNSRGLPSRLGSAREIWKPAVLPRACRKQVRNVEAQRGTPWQADIRWHATQITHVVGTSAVGAQLRVLADAKNKLLKGLGRGCRGMRGERKGFTIPTDKCGQAPGSSEPSEHVGSCQCASC